MRKMIAGILAGLVLGISGTAVAASSYWNEGGDDYNCKGYYGGVFCNSGGYQVGVTSDYVFLTKGYGKPRTATTFGCKKRRSWASCITP